MALLHFETAIRILKKERRFFVVNEHYDPEIET